jgi:membrane protein insertase Oxa1/YidC/SpoIIIJ
MKKWYKVEKINPIKIKTAPIMRSIVFLFALRLIYKIISDVIFIYNFIT